MDAPSPLGTGDEAHALLLAGLSALGSHPAQLERAAEVATAVRSLTQDQELARAAFIKVAATNADLEQIKPLASVAVLRLARELGSLGDFGFARQWSARQGLNLHQSEVLRKMLLAVVSDPRLVLARLAEQLVRMRHARSLPEGERWRMALETRAIFAPLSNRLGAWNLKWELEDLAFRELEPQQYRRIADALNEKRSDRESYIARVCELLASELAKAGITAQVYGRPKHIYSIHRKMQRKLVGFDQLFDIRAVRVLVDSVEACYAALGVVHGKWAYVAGEFDDYIATPKENSYRSIHTAVVGPQQRSLEIQIRTHEMQQQADLGVAAHWLYKEGANRDAAYERKIRWVRQLLEPAGGPGESQDLIQRVSAELFGDRVYALTPRGDVVDLPRNSTPLDFAYHLHTGLGHRCRGARIDGRIVPLTHTLRNGDVVEIIAGKAAAPSRDWLDPERGFLASSRGRAKLRAYFRQREKAEGGASPAAVPPPAGGVPARSSPPRRAHAARSARSASPVTIEGVKDLPVTLARCCGPAPPQPIAGYLTLARGVTVHLRDCTGLARMRRLAPMRVLQAQWQASMSKTD